MIIKICFYFVLWLGVFLPISFALSADQLLYTKKTLNYRIESLFAGSQLEKTEYFDIHTGHKLTSSEWLDTELVTEERFEDSDNIMIIQYDLAGNLLSRKAFKKRDKSPGEIRLSEEQIEALKKYDVDDEELEIIKIDWDSIIFADSNYAREIVLRWSETKDYRIKTEYSREGLIMSRIVWNKHTGQKLEPDQRVYAQIVEHDIVQNFRGFMEISYNILGKISAIRSWDRTTGRVLPPPNSIPFTNRLERDFLRLDYQEHREFEQEYFQVRTTGKEIILKDSESLFAAEKKRYRFWENVQVAPLISPKLTGRVGYQKQGYFTGDNIKAFRVRSEHQPGKYKLYNNLIHLRHHERTRGDFIVKSLRYPLGAEQKISVFHNDLYVKKTTFSRHDAEINLIGGVKLSAYDLKFTDGSRRAVYHEYVAAPIFGLEGVHFLSRQRKLLASINGTKMSMGSVSTSSLHKSIELRQEFPVSMSRLFKCWEFSVGYEHTRNDLTTDTSSLRPVHFDTVLKAAHLGFNVKF